MDIEYELYILRQHVAVAQEAKRERYGDDLFDWSIKCAESIIQDLEVYLRIK